jgi:hypothetical protein
MTLLTLRIMQDSELRRENYWDWWAWIEGTDAELDTIALVTWYLHSSFPNPVRRTTERTTKFMLKTAGWGTFLLRAAVQRGETTSLLNHYLSFRGERTAASPSYVVVYPAEDADLAAQVTGHLRSVGANVLDPTSSDFELPLLVGRSDGVISVARDTAPSRLVTAGLSVAKQLKTPVLSLADSEEVSAKLNAFVKKTTKESPK